MQYESILALLLGLERSEIEQVPQDLIDILDVLDGDSDLEETGTEDSFEDLSRFANGPGCLVADPGGGGDGDDQDAAWRENPRGMSQESLYAGTNEDDEDSDSDFGRDEGEPYFNDPLSRRGDGPGCIISDPDYGAEEAGEPEAC